MQYKQTRKEKIWRWKIALYTKSIEAFGHMKILGVDIKSHTKNQFYIISVSESM